MFTGLLFLCSAIRIPGMTATFHHVLMIAAALCVWLASEALALADPKQ
jgi:hypothetical protein